MDELEKLRRDLERLVGGLGRRSDEPYAAELEYHLSQLNSALTGFSYAGIRSMYARQASAELLAQIDSLLKRTDEIRELAERVREVLLRPPPEENKAAPGFAE